VLQQVIEHVADPAAVIRKIARLLRPGGVAVFETPNTNSWDHRLFRARYWGGYHIPRHFFLFDPGSFTRLAESNGLRVRRIEALLSPSFWTQSIHHWLAERGAPAFLRHFFHPQTPNGLGLAFFAALDAAGTVFRRTSNMRIIAEKR
jgi:SAM-dependent methyltransferase